jgi:hypothetical protein
LHLFVTGVALVGNRHVTGELALQLTPARPPATIFNGHLAISTLEQLPPFHITSLVDLEQARISRRGECLVAVGTTAAVLTALGPPTRFESIPLISAYDHAVICNAASNALLAGGALITRLVLRDVASDTH